MSSGSAFLEGVNGEITLTATEEGLNIHPRDASGCWFGPHVLKWETLDRLRKGIPKP